MHCRSPTPFAKLLELNLALNFLFIFGAPIVNALAFGALEFNESVLRHKIKRLRACKDYTLLKTPLQAYFPVADTCQWFPVEPA